MNFGFGFGAKCGEIRTFSRHSVSSESNCPTFSILSVSAWREVCFRWSPKSKSESLRQWCQMQWLSVMYTRTRHPCPALNVEKGLRQPRLHDLNVIFSHRHLHIKSVSGYRAIVYWCQSFSSAMYCFGSEHDPLSVSTASEIFTFTQHLELTRSVCKQSWSRAYC